MLLKQTQLMSQIARDLKTYEPIIVDALILMLDIFKSSMGIRCLTENLLTGSNFIESTDYIYILLYLKLILSNQIAPLAGINPYLARYIAERAI